MEKLITPEVGVIFWTLVTFLALLFVLGKYAWKPILNAIDERERKIKESLGHADNARAEAEKLLRDQRELLEKARDEAVRMLEAGKQEAERIRGDLIDQAKRQQQEMLEQGRIKIEQETRAALKEIKEKTADLAITAAGRLIQVSLDKESQRRLVERYIEELSKKDLA